MNQANSVFDSTRFKQSQQQQWNEDAEGWYRWTPVQYHWFAQAIERLLDEARLQPGQRVLDIASGAGQPAISAAQRVGPGGSVLATDLSENILRFAARAAAEAGAANLETRVMDGEHPDLPDASVDAVLCQFGLMLMPNVQQALREWRRVLKPGGRVAVSVFSTPDRNPWGAVPIGVIRRRAQLPPPTPGMPGIFALGAPGALGQALEQAGFEDVQTHTLTATLRMQSAKEAITFARKAFGGFNQMMAHLPPAERESVWDEVAETMRVYEGPDGYQVTAEPVIASGSRGLGD